MRSQDLDQNRTADAVLLARTAGNTALYAALVAADGARHIENDTRYSAESRYRLIRVDHRLNTVCDSDFEVALIDDEELSVAYYVKATLQHIQSLSSRRVVGIQIWRSANVRHSLALREISQKVLFGYIIKDYDIILAEDAVADGGKFYWHRQVSRAVEGGLNVCAYDPVTQELRPISSQRALNDFQDEAWAGTNGTVWRALISIFPLGSS